MCSHFCCCCADVGAGGAASPAGSVEADRSGGRQGHGERAVEQDAGTCLSRKLRHFSTLERFFTSVLKMGHCGITSSKTVLVFLNLIFWVSRSFLPVLDVRHGRS